MIGFLACIGTRATATQVDASSSDAFVRTIIAKYFSPEFGDALLWGAEVEVETKTFPSRSVVADRLRNIFRGSLDEDSWELENTALGTISLHDDLSASAEIVTSPLPTKKVGHLAWGLDLIGRQGDIVGTDDRNSVGTHLNMSTGLVFNNRMLEMETKDFERWLRNLIVNFYRHYPAIVRSEGVANKRLPYAAPLEEAFLKWFEREQGIPFDEIVQRWKGSKHDWRYYGANVVPKHGDNARIEFRFPNTVLGTQKKPHAGSRHLMRWLHFLTGLSYVSHWGVVDGSGHLKTLNKTSLVENFSLEKLSNKPISLKNLRRR